jgi:GT2 family glycosyltransferase
MSTPTPEELPDPPAGVSGWPWTEGSDPLPDTKPSGEPWPKVSVVTPGYNHGQFVEKTIRSVLLQGYPNLEYVVMDGGSTDETVEILETYDPWIDSWVSEPDDGQSDAINKGFRRSTGTYGSWINSDDWLCQGALAKHARQVGFDEDRLYAGVCLIYRDGTLLRKHETTIRKFEELVRVPEFWHGEERGYIVQPETLYPIEAFRAVGGVNVDNHYSMDFELWGDMLLEGVAIEKTGIEYGAQRRHEGQKTSEGRNDTVSLIAASHRLVEKCPKWSTEKKKSLHAELDRYEEKTWRETGRLARLGFPRALVRKIRSIRGITQ